MKETLIIFSILVLLSIIIVKCDAHMHIKENVNIKWGDDQHCIGTIITASRDFPETKIKCSDGRIIRNPTNLEYK